ncbi:hypothetical protein IWQ61_001868 [Dispira simplex]|nr:hypothetical protein IWQ61_001868 [Dispira simplex]
MSSGNPQKQQSPKNSTHIPETQHPNPVPNNPQEAVQAAMQQVQQKVEFDKARISSTAAMVANLPLEKDKVKKE